VKKIFFLFFILLFLFNFKETSKIEEKEILLVKEEKHQKKEEKDPAPIKSEDPIAQEIHSPERVHLTIRKDPAPIKSEDSKMRWSQTGTASWYGSCFHGRTTANGETYNMYALTAAHKELPFGTIVRVTHLENGSSVVVRINDRGPFVKGRIIDLSLRAAEEIGMKSQGIAKVKVEIISP